MTVEIISWSISAKVWGRAGIELSAPGPAVRLAYDARHVTDCATRHVQMFNVMPDNSYDPGETVRYLIYSFQDRPFPLKYTEHIISP